MPAERAATTVKPASTFRVDWLIYLLMWLCWVPLGMQGKLQADGSTLTTLRLGLFHYGDANFLSGAGAFSYEVRLAGWMRILLTIGATAVLSLVCRYLTRRSTERLEATRALQFSRSAQQTRPEATNSAH